MKLTPMGRIKSECAGMDERLAELLLAPTPFDLASAPAKVQTHLAECDRCRGELEELRATMALMDSWEAPEPNPYFLTRLNARMQEERQAAQAGWRWIARLRDRFTYGPATHMRPLAAMAMTIMLLVGGGTYLGITYWDQAHAPAGQTGQAAVVSDLQTMDSNAQLLDQLEALSDPNGADTDNDSDDVNVN